jgi:hypothetical protein
LGRGHMRLLLRRRVQENKLLRWRTEFVLWARFELNDEERALVRKYDMEKGYLRIPLILISHSGRSRSPIPVILIMVFTLPEEGMVHGMTWCRATATDG